LFKLETINVVNARMMIMEHVRFICFIFIRGDFGSSAIV
jgi:hypothetical protein